MKESERFAFEAKDIIKQADLEARELEPEEAGKVEELLERSRRAREQESAAPVQFQGMGPTGVGADVSVGSPGERFVRSKGYMRIRSADSRGEVFTSGKIDVGGLLGKGTILSGGTIGGYGPYQQAVPGVVPIAEQPVVVSDVIPSVPATAPDVRFYKERVATNAAAGVAEGAAKPESALDFQEESVKVTKVATFLPVSDEFLEDAPAVQTYLNSRLAMFVRTEEELQILRGAGAASNEVEGFIDNYALNSVGTATGSGAAGTAIANTIFTVANNQRGSSMLDPDTIVVHPTQYANMRLSRDSQGQYFGGGPFVGPYGGPQGPASASRFSSGSYWNLQVLVSTYVGSGRALIGAFSQGARVYRRGGITVEASNSHGEFFRQNLTALRAESRLGLAVLRPEAFTVLNFS